MNFELIIYDSSSKNYLLDPNDTIPAKFMIYDTLTCYMHRSVMFDSIEHIRELVKYLILDTNYFFEINYESDDYHLTI